jgi:hypothetical protein
VVLAAWCNNGAQILGLIVKLEGVELHCDIELAEEGVARALGQDVLDARKRIHMLMDDLAQGREVGDDAHSAIFLGDSKSRSS